MAHITVPPGGGSPGRVHDDEEEIIFVREGVVDFTGDLVTPDGNPVSPDGLAGMPGTYVIGKPGSYHAWSSQTGAKMLVVFIPAELLPADE